MEANKKVKVNLKTPETVSQELQGTYGNSLVIMTSNPEELVILSKKLKNEYDAVSEMMILDNNDYAQVFIRKDE